MVAGMPAIMRDRHASGVNKDKDTFEEQYAPVCERSFHNDLPFLLRNRKESA